MGIDAIISIAGNILKKISENYDIVYNYGNGRLKHIHYPGNEEMDVYYEYGAAGSGNQSGRLIKQQDASGVQTFRYGNMGELIGNIHTYVVPGGESYTFEMRWNYDSWNRLINIQYPDGELVNYQYDNGGKLISMNGEKLGQQYYYIKEIIYDKFDSRTNIYYGNGTYSEYYYDPLNRRLKNLKSYDANGHKMHDIDYKYDGVGNIIYQSNNGEYVYNGAGGPYKYDYKYDELYRLIYSGGNFESNNNGNMYYNLNMSYSPSGNITNKQLYGQTLINGGVNNIDYNRDYQYNGRPHQVTNAGENEYEWDGNGNMIFRNTPQGKRYQCWDNEDRLVAVHDEGDMPQISAYLYDGGGERVWKLTGGVIQNYMNGQQIYSSGHLDKTLYASPYMVMTEQEYTKHYYIEGERICSKIGSGFQGAHTPPKSTPIDFIAGSAQICSMQLREMVGRNAQCAMYNGGIDIDPYLPPAHNDGNEYEKLQYFYHSDHLGSASFVTNAEGYVEQHLQYLPFGELFVSQRNSEFDSRYKFTAKELDNETNYSYFGARYYDSDLSSWLSVDPMSDKYPSLSPYCYSADNPVILKDPNGNEPVLWYVGKIQDFINVLNNSPNKVGLYKGNEAHNYMLNLGKTEWQGLRPMPKETYFNTKKGRYIYTEKGGWIDMSHFMFYAGRAYYYKQQKVSAQHAIEEMEKEGGAALQGMSPIISQMATMDPVLKALCDGYMQEITDLIFAPYSAFSYEDLPSDKFGADFGANYFNPNSNLTLSEQLGNYFNNVLKATEPEKAPNYKILPSKESKNPPKYKNRSSVPMFTDDN